MISAIYLSPHLDDAALSCGGQIARLTRRGKRVLAVTVCAGDPPFRAVHSPFVAELHRRWAAQDAVTARRAEDLRALQTLQAEALYLNLPDCIYRVDPRTGQPLYPNREAIFGNLAEQETFLINQLARELERLEPLWGAVVYVPLGAGHHVDHQLVRLAAERWGAPGGHLVYYEDYPYAETPAELARALAGSRLIPVVIRLSQQDIQRKIRAVARYKSQLSTFFANTTEMSHRLMAFARSKTDQAGLAEQVWTDPAKIALYKITEFQYNQPA